MFIIRKILSVFILTLLSVSCANNDKEVVWDFNFYNLEPFVFKAATVEIIDLYQPPLVEPNIEHTFPISPATATKAWVKSRIKVDGSNGAIIVRIIDASVVSSSLPTAGGLMGLLFDQQAVRYQASLEVEIEYQGNLALKSSAQTLVTRSRTVPESVTLKELDHIFHNLLEGLMADLDRQLSTAINQSLGGLIL